MSVGLRAILIICCLCAFIYVYRKVAKSKLKIEESIFWIVFSIVLIIISIFTDIPFFISEFLGFETPVNCVFLLIIFLLLVKCFQLSQKIADLECKLTEYIQKNAISSIRSEEKDENPIS